MQLRPLLVSLFLTALASALAVPAALAGGVGALPHTTPVAGPVEVFVLSSTEDVTPGGIVVADVAIVNSSPDISVYGALKVTLVLSDGRRQALRFPHPLRLDPDSTLVYQVFLIVPEDAPLGTGRLTATATVGYPAHGQAMAHVARDSDTFEVVAP